jgi:hypothetical protein
MKKYVVRIRPNGEITAEPVGDDLLHDLQRLVGGYIEEMPRGIMLPVNTVMLANEEAIIRDYPYNPAATQIANYKILGDAVIVRQVPGDIAAFGSKSYIERYLIEPLKFKLAAALESHE